MFNELQPRRHEVLRARVAEGYTGKGVEELEPAISDQVKALVSLIREKYISDDKTLRKAEFSSLCTFLTMDVITTIGTGEAFGYLRTDSDVYGYLEQTKSLWGFMGMTLDVPYLRNIAYSNPFLKLFGPKKSDMHGLGRLMGYVVLSLSFVYLLR